MSAPTPAESSNASALAARGSWGYFLLAFLCLLLSLCVAYHVANGVTSPREMVNRVLMSSDELFAAALYDDLVSGRTSWQSFRFSAATFVVPDLLVFALVRWLTGAANTAVVVWAVVAFLGLVATLAAAVRLVVPSGRGLIAAGGVLCLASTYFAYNSWSEWEHRYLAEFALPLYHGGAVIGILLSLVLLARIVRGASWRFVSLIGLYFLSALLTFSDRLFAVWFPLPLFLASLVTYFLGSARSTSWRGFLLAFVAIGAGCVTGARVVRLWEGSDDSLTQYWQDATFSEIPRLSFLLSKDIGKELLSGNLLLWSAFFWHLLSLGTLIARWQDWRRGMVNPNRPSGNNGFVFLAVFTLASTAITWLVFCQSRYAQYYLSTHPWEEYCRYFLLSEVLGWFGWAAWLAHYTAPGHSRFVRWLAFMVPLLLGFITPLIAATHIRDPIRNVFDFYPNDVRSLDETCTEQGVSLGLADYGLAKRVTVLSRRGVVMRQVMPEGTGPRPLQGFHWLSNAAWYWQPAPGQLEPPRYQFLIAQENPGHGWIIATSKAENFFGPADRHVPTIGCMMLIYDSSKPNPIRDFATLDPIVLQLRERYER